MAGTNLTMMVIGIAAIILVVGMTTQFYVDVMDKNGGSIDSTYSAQYAEIAGYNNSLSSFQAGLTQNVSIWSSIPTFLGSSFNVLAIGLSGVTQFFSLLTIIPNFFTSVLQGLGLPPLFTWFILTILGVFIVTKIYKAIRSSPEEI